MPRSARKCVVALAFLPMLIVPSRPASAATIATQLRNVESHFDDSGPEMILVISGDIRSPVRACRVNRQVTFFLKDGDTGGVNKNWDFGSKYGTDTDGHFEVRMSGWSPFDGGHDSFVVKTVRKTPGANTCATDKVVILTPAE